MNQAIYVIGGGIIGLLSARELAQAGRRVVLLDRQAPGRESSWAGGGILSPLYPWKMPEAVLDLYNWSRGRYPALIGELQRETRIECEYGESGLLNLDENIAEIVDKYAKNMHISVDSVKAESLHALEPALSTIFNQAYFFPDIAQARNPRLLEALVNDLGRLGVEIKPNITVAGFRSEQRGLKAVLTNQGELPANQCVVCAGAWTAGLLAQTGLALPIKPIRGQMLLYRGRPDQLRHIIVQNYRYLIPRRDGYILAGSTLEDVGFDPSITDVAKAEMHADAIRIMPALADSPLEAHWAGLRPGTPEGVPYIGEHPAITGLFVCAGHHRNGLALAPASARLCADLMLKKKPLIPPASYRLNRDRDET